jgi:hypothetical protein
LFIRTSCAPPFGCIRRSTFVEAPSSKHLRVAFVEAPSSKHLRRSTFGLHSSKHLRRSTFVEAPSGCIRRSTFGSCLANSTACLRSNIQGLKIETEQEQTSKEPIYLVCNLTQPSLRTHHRTAVSSKQRVLLIIPLNRYLGGAGSIDTAASSLCAIMKRCREVGCELAVAVKAQQVRFVQICYVSLLSFIFRLLSAVWLSAVACNPSS